MELGTTPNAPRPVANASDSGEVFATYVEPILARKWLVLAIALLVGVGVTFWTLRQPKVYEASATIEYDPNPPRPLGRAVEDVASPASNFWMTREFFETQNRILGSRSVAERVVRRLGLHQDPAFFGVPAAERDSWRGGTVEDAAIRLQRRISIEPQNGTRLVDIRVRDLDPERAAQLANALADTYIEKTIEDRLSSTVTALEWLGTQLDTLRNQLSESELALHRFKEEHNVLSLSMEDRQNLIASEIEHFSGALTKVRTDRVELSARVARLRAAIRDGQAEDQAAALTDAPTIATLREQLRTKLSERDTLALTYGQAHPRIRALNGEIDALREQIGREITGIVRAAEADLVEAQATERGLRELLDGAQTAGLELNLREIEYQRLNRQRENNEKLYNVVLERSTETDLTRMLRTTHVRVVDRALPRRQHVSPLVTVNVGGGILAGLVLGIAIAFGLGRLDRRIKTAEEAERIGGMVLGVLPIIEEAPNERATPTRARRGRRKREGSTRDLIVHERPMSAAAEGFRSIRTNLTFMDLDGGLRAVVVTSAEPEDGKTTVTANLAISFAQSGKRVLVVDADLRRPRVHLAFRVEPGKGVSNVLIGAARLEDAIQRTEIPNLDVLPCGPIPPNPSELLHHRGFRELLDKASERFDLVMFDSPPVGVVSDAAVIAPQVGGVVLVARVNSTTRDALRGALRQFGTVGARVLGVVVNGVDPRRRGYGYGSSYAYGSRSYYGERAESGDDENAREAAE